MKFLIVGSGGREHALAWKIAQSPSVKRVYVAPGNAGTDRETGVENVAIDVLDFEALLNFVFKQSIGLTLVGPEAPLAQGIVEYFRQRGRAVIGPTRAAARLEWSKGFSKEFMYRHGVPTAAYGMFDVESEALAYLENCKIPVVVKADGLAAGKGVVVADTRAQAAAAVRGMLSGKDFGTAGRRVIIEEFLRGEELSFICLVDGRHALPLATSQDYKARDEGNRGPNTGGMGAYSPVASVDDALRQRILHEVIQPTVKGMREEGAPFVGFLYAGLMIDAGRPSVLEFNCRLGDPETQPILMRLRSDLVELCRLTLAGRLDDACVEWDERSALGVVMAAGGYPGTYAKGDVITGLDSADGDETVKVFHAGTQTRGDEIVTAGGRVLCVTALADDVEEAATRAYQVCEKISWPGSFYRGDVGRGVTRR